ncbi:hypothetical protein VTI74DRAFT_608 [Chaetomium olivicolor]
MAFPVIRYFTSPTHRDAARSPAIPDDRGKLLAFDTVPAGDWNLGHLVIPGGGSGNAKGKYALALTESVPLDEAVILRDAGPAWCNVNTKFDLTDLLDAFYAQRKKLQPANDNDSDYYYPHTDIQCMVHLHAAVLPNPEEPHKPNPVIGVWAWEPGLDGPIANESHIYSVIQARDIGLAPRFLGHITDNGTRVVGFLLERIAEAREAGPADFEKCEDALRRLHALGITYGGFLRRHSFLVCEDGTVLLQGFGGAFETEDEPVLRREIDRLEKVLAAPSEMGKVNCPRPSNAKL